MNTSIEIFKTRTHPNYINNFIFIFEGPIEFKDSLQLEAPKYSKMFLIQAEHH